MPVPKRSDFACGHEKSGYGLVRYRADTTFSRHYHAGVPRLCLPSWSP